MRCELSGQFSPTAGGLINKCVLMNLGSVQKLDLLHLDFRMKNSTGGEEQGTNTVKVMGSIPCKIQAAQGLQCAGATVKCPLIYVFSFLKFSFPLEKKDREK